MDLYRLTSKTLKPVSERGFKLEKDLQKIVDNNLETLFSLEFVCSELRVGGYRLDTVAFDRKKCTFVIIEYKKNTNRSVIDQGHLYHGLMLKNKAEFVLKHREETGSDLRKSEVDWEQARILYIAPSFNVYQTASTDLNDVSYELWQIKRYEGNQIALARFSTATLGVSSKTIRKLPDRKRRRPEKSKQETASVGGLLENTSRKCRAIWKRLKKEIEELGDWQPVRKKYFVAFIADKHRLCFVYFLKDRIKIHVRRGAVHSDGTRTKGFFSWHDAKSLAGNSSTETDGYVRHQYVIEVREAADIDYAVSLLKQKNASFNSKSGVAKAKTQAHKAEGIHSENDSKLQQDSLSKLLVKTNSECRSVWEALKARIERLGDWKTQAANTQVGFKSRGKALCVARFHKNHFNIFCWRGAENPDGTRQKNFFTWDDPKALSTSKTRNGHGKIMHDYMIKVSSIDELDYVMYLVKQKHDLVMQQNKSNKLL